MSDLAVKFNGVSDEIFYRILRALTQMKEKGIEKIGFVERFDRGWVGEIQFLSKEAMEIFGNKIRSRRK